MKYPLSEVLTGSDNDPDQLRIVLIGSAERIARTTRQLHSLGFADLKDWSPVLPLPNSDELFCLLTRSKRT